MTQPKLVQATPNDLPLFRNLMQLYLHDFSENADADSEFGAIGADGLFTYGSFEGLLETFFEEAERSAWLFYYPTPKLGDTIAGFALVNRYSPSGDAVDHVVAEYHILRKFRGTGFGKAAAHALFNALPGTWELGVADYNSGALKFWPKVVTSGPCRNAQRLEGDGDRWSGDIWRFDV